MRAIHAYSSKPPNKWFSREQMDGRCRFEDFELLMLSLSALAWRRHSGSVKLYTDDTCARYFQARGLEVLWDDGIDTVALAEANLDTNYLRNARPSGQTASLPAVRCASVLVDRRDAPFLQELNLHKQLDADWRVPSVSADPLGGDHGY
jgi:hypothetical protein